MDNTDLFENCNWIFRPVISVSIILSLWCFRFKLGNWAIESWQNILIWGFVIITLIDLINSLKNPLILILKNAINKIRHSYDQKRKKTTINESQTYADKPITSLSEDQLGFAKYAFVIARFLAHCDTPLTIGIHGEWGSGKTSLANLVCYFLTPREEEIWKNNKELMTIQEELVNNQQYLDKQLPNEVLNKIEIIWLNAWQYSSSLALWRALILCLSKRLEEKGFLNEISYWQRNLYYSINKEYKGEIQLNKSVINIAFIQTVFLLFISFLMPSTWLLLLLQFFGVCNLENYGLVKFSDLFEQQKYTLMRKQMESIEEFQDAFQNLVRKLLNRKLDDPIGKNKIIIVIDDLDRCIPTVALEIMETIKTFLDIPGCAYILLCDQQLLGQGVKAKYGELLYKNVEEYQRRGREYIEKIIQVSFQIPPSDRELYKACIENSISIISGYRSLPYFDIVFAAVQGNPRKIKRLCMGLEIAFDMMELSVGKFIEKNKIPDQTYADETSSSNANIRDRKEEFAKIYCLLYQWPEALPFLRHYQSNKKIDFFPIPNKINSWEKDRRLNKKTTDIEMSNLLDANKRIQELLNKPDLRLFANLILSIDWDQALRIGDRAIVQRNSELLNYLNIKPQINNMGFDDLKNYIEWSGVISSQEYKNNKIPSEIISTPIENLDLSVRVYNSLKKSGIQTVGEVVELLEKGDNAVMSIKNFGDESLNDLRQKMIEKGYLKDESETNYFSS